MNNLIKTGKKIFTVSVVVTTIAWSMGLAVLLLPLSAQAAVLSAGDLIKKSDASAVYYYGSDGKRYVFPNQETYMSWYSDFSAVKTITSDELAAVSIGGNVTMRPGTKLVKISSDSKTYAVSPGGSLHWIKDETTAKALYGSTWNSKVVTVLDAFFTNYKAGSDITSNVHPNGALVKYASSTDVFLIDGGLKRKIKDATAFLANRYKWSDIVVIADTITYTAGSDVVAAESKLTDLVSSGSAAPAAGELTVALASDTPASASVADAANTNFTKINMTTGASAVSVSSLYVKRSGLSANADVENIKVTNLNGVNVGSVGSLNTDGRALITFSPALSVSANTTNSYYLKAGVVDNATGGKTINLGINAATDINAGSSTVKGSFPVVGNAMSIVNVTVGTVSVTNDGSVVDTTPDSGDKDVVVNKFTVSVNSTEDVTLESLSILEAGTASLTDIKNIELYSVTSAKSLGEVAAWSANSQADFAGLNLVLAKGTTHRFEVRVDVVSGSSLTANADLTDGGDVLMSVKGNTYGFYITPSVTGSWNGQGSSSQTINAGSLTITKSSSTPATGNVAEADNQLLAIFDFDARGESVKITSLKVSADLGTMVETELTNIKIYDSKDNLIAGPQDLGTTDYTANSTTYEGFVTFTDTIIVPVGVNQYKVKAKISSDASTGDTVKMAIADADSDITARGFITNDSITATPAASNVAGNTMTVQAGALSATTLSQPAARSIAKGVSDFIWMTASLDATSSGEDVDVTALVAEDTLGDAADDSSTIDNLEVWADLTSANSSRGDAYETKVSNTEQPDDTGATDETHSFTLTQTVRVKKGSFVKIALVGDLNAGATTGDTHTFSLDTDSGDVTATGASTGTTVSVTPTGAGQTMTVAASGTLTISTDSSSPRASLVTSGQNKATLAVFRLAASAVEDLDLDSVKVTDAGSAGDTIGTYYLYSSVRADGGSVTDPIASAAGGASAEVFLSDGTVTIPSNNHVLITVKGIMNVVDGSQVSNGDTLKLNVAAVGDIDTTGKHSGAAVDSTATETGTTTHVLFHSVPTVSFASDTPSGTLVPSSNTLLAKIAVSASSTDDITFENGDGNGLTISVASSIADGGTTAVTWYLYDGDGTQLSSITGTALDTTVAFVFEDASFTVPKGATKYLKVYVATTVLEDTGDSIQVWLDDGTATYIDWGVNGSGSYNYGNIIFRGDLYGGALNKA